MENYTYQNKLISKKELRQLLAWSFSKYNSMQACLLADELKYLGFTYSTKAGISISIEDLKVPFCKTLLVKKANFNVLNTNKLYSKGKITEVEKLQKIIDNWSLTSEYLKKEVVYYFQNYDPLNSIYIMAFSGARGNLAQVKQLVGMRGLMADPKGEILPLPIAKNFREGLTITDYIISGYGARKGIIDTALKTANSGYLTRRLIDVAQDIIIREKDCFTNQSIIVNFLNKNQSETIRNKFSGYLLNKPIIHPKTEQLIADIDQRITSKLIEKLKKNNIYSCYIRSPLTCSLYRAICQKCYGYDLSTERLIDLGATVGIIAGQSIGEPGTQLTMRTFHTGGIFNSKQVNQVLSPVKGLIKFSRFLKTQPIRTNRGDNVLLTKNSGFIIIFTNEKTFEFVRIEILPNMLLFIKNNTYIIPYELVAEFSNTTKNIRKELKSIKLTESAEIFFPKIKNKINLLKNNQLLWLLAGDLYSAPINSFINFYNHYTLFPNSFVFRSKILSPSLGNVKFVNTISNLFERIIQIQSKDSYFSKSILKHLVESSQKDKFILQIKNLYFFTKLKTFKNQVYFPLKCKRSFAQLITNHYTTATGGTLNYNVQYVKNFQNSNRRIQYLIPMIYEDFLIRKSIDYKTIVWLPTETYKLKIINKKIKVKNNAFIKKSIKITSNIYSKNAGVVTIKKNRTSTKVINIKPGKIFDQNYSHNIDQKIFFPGEIIENSLFISQLSYCEYVTVIKKQKLLLRNFQIFEIPKQFIIPNIKSNHQQNLVFTSSLKYLYKSGQTIQASTNNLLLLNSINISQKRLGNHRTVLFLQNNRFQDCIDIERIQTLNLINFIHSKLKYKNLNCCLLIEKKQYTDLYSILGYVEKENTLHSKVVSIKYKMTDIKQIHVILNKHCEIMNIPTTQTTTSQYLYSPKHLNKVGRIIKENKQIKIIQKGKLYCFPNCHPDLIQNKTNIYFKILKTNKYSYDNSLLTSRRLSINYYDLNKKQINRKAKLVNSNFQNMSLSLQLTRLFLKKDKKFYSYSTPKFFQQFSINQSVSANNLFKNIIRKNTGLKNFSHTKKQERTLIIKSVVPRKQVLKNTHESTIFMKFLEHPFSKSIFVHSLSDSFLKQEFNTLFCKNGEFIEQGEIIGLLHCEKEITGDIVQGLPRVDELLEGRKNRVLTKITNIHEKKNLLIEHNTLNTNFDFQKIGTPINETDKINPHNLLKIYFNYYGLLKPLLTTNHRTARFARLLDNFNGSYKAFKKVQSLILNAVQSVYESQGVTIADKHLEIIIKQMSTKVLITYEGHTPLLPKEMVDLYHINYINKTIKDFKKLPAYYVPILLGITKAALNNPSFISAASFQETTRILTKCALEGRIDWLRGLKENIITGHLIPAGTGYQSYQKASKS